MTEHQIKYGIWHIEKGISYPKNSVTEIEEYQPTEKLRLFITQTGKSSRQQKKLIKLWADKLPELRQVKYLWFSSKVNQEMFDAACEMTSLEGLYIKWSSIIELKKIKNLSNLKHFYLGQTAGIERIEDLSSLKYLETLGTEALGKISDFSVISELTELKGLGIDGGMSKAQIIDNLKPLRKLNKLKYLTLTNTKILDKSLEPLTELGNLVRFNCSLNYPEAEFKQLKALSNLKYGNVLHLIKK